MLLLILLDFEIDLGQLGYIRLTQRLEPTSYIYSYWDISQDHSHQVGFNRINLEEIMILVKPYNELVLIVLTLLLRVLFDVLKTHSVICEINGWPHGQCESQYEEWAEDLLVEHL